MSTTLCANPPCGSIGGSCTASSCLSLSSTPSVSPTLGTLPFTPYSLGTTTTTITAQETVSITVPGSCCSSTDLGIDDDDSLTVAWLSGMTGSLVDQNQRSASLSSLGVSLLSVDPSLEQTATTKTVSLTATRLETATLITSISLPTATSEVVITSVGDPITQPTSTLTSIPITTTNVATPTIIPFDGSAPPGGPNAARGARNIAVGLAGAVGLLAVTDWTFCTVACALGMLSVVGPVATLGQDYWTGL